MICFSAVTIVICLIAKQAFTCENLHGCHPGKTGHGGTCTRRQGYLGGSPPLMFSPSPLFLHQLFRLWGPWTWTLDEDCHIGYASNHEIAGGKEKRDAVWRQQITYV